jgi:hypothetical protein
LTIFLDSRQKYAAHLFSLAFGLEGVDAGLLSAVLAVERAAALPMCDLTPTGALPRPVHFLL